MMLMNLLLFYEVCTHASVAFEASISNINKIDIKVNGEDTSDDIDKLADQSDDTMKATLDLLVDKFDKFEDIMNKFISNNSSMPGAQCNNTDNMEAKLNLLVEKFDKLEDIMNKFISNNSSMQGAQCNNTATVRPTTTPKACGVYAPPVARDNKIVGGNETRENQFPWQAVMIRYNASAENKYSLWCGGSLINNQWVLTAAHCTDGYVVSDFQILLGAQCWANPPQGLLRLDVVQIIQNAGYKYTANDNDIALLKLDRSIDFYQSQFRPICLPVDSSNPIPDQDDVEAVISGFGTLDSDGNFPNCQQYAIVPTMTNTHCQDLYESEPITANMICAGFPGVGGIDSCQGDSGGPMATNATSGSVHYYVQIGIVSWGFGCANPDYPGVYTRVTEYIEWITDNTAGSSTLPAPKNIN